MPIIRRELLYLCDTGICHSVWAASGLPVGLKIQHVSCIHVPIITRELLYLCHTGILSLCLDDVWSVGCIENWIRASMCSSSGENYCIYATLVFCHSVWMASGLLVGLKIQPADQTPPKQSDKIPVSHRYSNSLLMMGTWMHETC